MNTFNTVRIKFRWEKSPQNDLHVRKTTQFKQICKYSSASGGIQTGVHNTKADQLFKENSLKNR
jgi:hypothetical protein